MVRLEIYYQCNTMWKEDEELVSRLLGGGVNWVTPSSQCVVRVVYPQNIGDMENKKMKVVVVK